MKYWTRPVVVEAMQWDGSASAAIDVIEWVYGRRGLTVSYLETNETDHREHPELSIEIYGREPLTLEFRAAPNDWIIIDPSGIVTRRSPASFAARYEAVTGDE
jgi:hypothetical protein